MRLKQEIPARLAFGAATALAAVPVRIRPASVRIRTAAAPAGLLPLVQAPAPAPRRPPTGPEVQLTADEAVRMALENNLGVQSDRLAPQISNLNVAQARARVHADPVLDDPDT